MTAAPGAMLGQNRQFDMDAAVVRLMALAANKRAHRPVPKDDAQQVGQIVATPFRLFNISDYPEPSPEWKAADRAIKDFADELHAIGGMDLMLEVYDETIERHGYRAASGISPSWDGCHGWWH